jgi:hypothetical protein
MESITAQSIVSLLSGEGLYMTLINLIVLLAGLFTNVYNQMKREGIGFFDYWTYNGKRSIASISALITTFIGMSMLSTPLYAYFTTGLATDFLVNKAPRKEDLIDKE